MIEQLQTQLDNVQGRARAILASLNGRTPSDDERRTVDALIAEGKALRARLDAARADSSMTERIAQLSAGMTSTGGGGRCSNGGGRRGSNDGGLRSMGEQFVGNPDYREFIRRGAHRSSSAWTAPALDFHATTLDESAGSGAGLVRTEYLPGVVETPLQPVKVLDLFAQGTTGSSSITFMKETTFTNAAAAVAEGTAKPESTLVIEPATSPTQKIAHWIPVTSEILEDFSGTQAYVDGRLRRGLEVKTDDQLINGNGTPPQLEGILARGALAAPIARVAQTNADVIAAQIAAIEQATLLPVDGVILNPVNWLAIQLLKNAAGDYISGAGPIGPPAPPTLWGRRVAVSPVIALGTALVGCFQSAAAVFHHGSGIRVEASTSHSSFFVENRVALLCERRLNLVIFRENAFGIVTNLTA